ncbi:MAG: hypothetical protein DRJ51_08940 [Thermoprotei archaeon]|nr:MAG: hypothetical protein DRJ51_08940 [Thermoprotei archaeon]
MSKSEETEEFMNAEELRKRLIKLGINVEFSDEHLTKTHRDVKAILEALLKKAEETQSHTSLGFTDKEIEYLIFYLSRWSEEAMASKLIEKLVGILQQKRAPL